jgi:hypothetical protein
MTTATQSGRDIASDVSRRTSQRLYEAQHYGNSADHCNRQLDRRSYYFTPDTRRYFGSRVLDVSTYCDDLILCAIESVSPPNSSRVYRCVFFDLLGNIIHRTEKNDDSFGHKSASTARKERDTYAATLTTEAEAARVMANAIGEAERTLAQLTA